MTNEQFDRAHTIQFEINESNIDLNKICNLQDQISEIYDSGIYIISDGTRIFPIKEEISVLLVTMRNRLENRIAELEKEFAEL